MADSDEEYRLFREYSEKPDRLDDAIGIIRKLDREGRPGAYNELADVLVKRGKPEDLEEAIALCEKGMVQGNLWSQARLSKYHWKGIGVEKDLDRAIDLMREPSDKRIKWAVKDMESMLLERNSEEDTLELFRTHLRGAFEGDEESRIKAARCYAKGTGVPKDEEMAIWIYSSISEKNEAARKELEELKAP